MNITTDITTFITNMIPHYTMDEVIKKLDKKKRKEQSSLLYLAHLCSRGEIDKIEQFLETFETLEKEGILNTKHPLFFDGTVFHIALYWNTGDRGMKLFHLLRTHGAVGIENRYKQYPWTQTGGGNWIDPISFNNYGKRDGNEFTELYKKINQFISLQHFLDNSG